ncbi:MAG: SEC-C domain-containing protein [Candidatus Eremiobacteraeota bacterium]|nr:SEC-C domain-containing protein [Candidatus Eremiobacteraeota bacterium]
MERVGFSDEVPIEAKLITHSIENAQRKVENHNYEIRKSVLEYDDVMNKQREIIYGERRKVLEGQPLRDFFVDALRRRVDFAVDTGAPPEEHPSEWDLPAILDELETVFSIKEDVGVEELEKLDRDGMKELLFNHALAAYEEKEAEVGPEIMRMVESQYIMLPIIDRLWVDHLYIMDALKSGIGLRGYGQKDPRVEYEKEAYEIFEDLKNNIADEALKAIFTVRIETAPPEGVYPPGGFAPDGTPLDANGQPLSLAELQQYANGHAPPAPAPQLEPLPTGALAPQPAESRLDPGMAERLLGPAPKYEPTQLHTNRGDGEPAKPKQVAAADKVGRNDLCPCGSGKKYKKCHGAAA